MITTEWLKKYESIKDKLVCKTNLEAHFTEKVIGNMEVDVLDIGAVRFPTGKIFACDPLMELDDTGYRMRPADFLFRLGRWVLSCLFRL